MDQQPQFQVPNPIDISKLHSIGKIQNAFLHEFKADNQRQLIDISQCQILQYTSIEGTQIPMQYLKMASLLQRIDNCVFVMATFQTLQTYVFENKENQNSLYLLSFQNYNPDLYGFSALIKDSTQVVEYKADNFQNTMMKQKMISVIGGQLTQEMIESVEPLNNVLKAVGNILGSVSKTVHNPTAKASQLMNSSFTTIKQKYISQQNKSRWNSLKQTAYTWNQKMTEMYKPIDNAFKKVVSTIGQSFSTSQNPYIKTVKKLSLATAKTLNNSYKKAQQQMMGNPPPKVLQSNPYGVEIKNQNSFQCESSEPSSNTLQEPSV